MLIQSLLFGEEEVLQKSITLSGAKMVYALGSEFGEIGLSGLLVSGLGHTVAAVLDWYEKARLSNTGQVTAVSESRGSGGGAGFRFLVTGVKMGEMDLEFGTREIMIMGLRAVPAAGGEV